MKRPGVLHPSQDETPVQRGLPPQYFVEFPQQFPVPIYTPEWREALGKVTCPGTQHSDLAKTRIYTSARVWSLANIYRSLKIVWGNPTKCW